MIPPHVGGRAIASRLQETAFQLKVNFAFAQLLRFVKDYYAKTVRFSGTFIILAFPSSRLNGKSLTGGAPAIDRTRLGSTCQ
jgi:hypothetical protein